MIKEAGRSRRVRRSASAPSARLQTSAARHYCRVSGFCFLAYFSRVPLFILGRSSRHIPLLVSQCSPLFSLENQTPPRLQRSPRAALMPTVLYCVFLYH